MSAPVYTEADYLAALQARLPRGRAWPRDDDAVLTKLLKGIALAQSRVGERAAALIVEAFPASTTELLPEWEASLGLPDACLGPNPLTSARRAQVVARLTFPGGQTVAYFLALAEALGGAITIQEFAPFRASIDQAMTPLYSGAWASIWQVTLTETALFFFEAELSHAGEPLWQLVGGAIACEIEKQKPGHTKVIFVAGAGVATGPFYADLTAAA